MKTAITQRLLITPPQVTTMMDVPSITKAIPSIATTIIVITKRNRCIHRIVTHFYLCTVQYKIQVLLHFSMFVFVLALILLLYTSYVICLLLHILSVLFLIFFLFSSFFIFKFNRSIFLLWIIYLSISTCVP